MVANRKSLDIWDDANRKLLRENFSNFGVPNFESKALGADVEPLSAKLNVLNMNSVYLGLDSIISVSKEKFKSLASINSVKIAASLENPSKLQIRIRRKRDRIGLLSVQLIPSLA